MGRGLCGGGGGGGGSHLRSRRLLQDDGAGQELGELVVVVGVIDPLQGNAPAGRQAAAPAAHPHHQRAGWRPTSPFAHPAHPSINPIYRLALPAHLSPHLMRRHPSGRTLVRRQKNHREIVVRQPALHAAAAPPDGTAPPSSPHLSLATLLPLRRDATAGDWRLAARSLAIGGWRRAAPGLNVGGAAAIVTVSSGSRWVPLSPGAAPRLLHPPPPPSHPFPPSSGLLRYGRCRVRGRRASSFARWGLVYRRERPVGAGHPSGLGPGLWAAALGPVRGVAPEQRRALVLRGFNRLRSSFRASAVTEKW